MVNKIVCAYCSRINNADLDHCEACGAPIEPGLVENIEEVQVPVVLEPSIDTPDPSDELEQVQKVLQVAGATYGVIWRTIGEAIAVAIVAFGLGILGALTDVGPGALLGAVLMGAAVGWVVKGFWPTLLGAPLGALIGTILGGLIWVSGGDPRWVVVATSLAAISGAVLGGRRSSAMNWWERFRPLFGALGAGFFALWGLFIGESLQQITQMFS